MLTVKALSYPKRLKNFSYSFYPKNIYSVIGLNGSGKSTLLNILSGKLSSKMVDGEVYLNDMNVLNMKSHLRATFIAMLSQNINVQFDYLAYDILTMGYYALRKNQINQYSSLKFIIDTLDLDHIIKKNYKELSEGQKKILHLGRVLLQLTSDFNKKRERWLLLDEQIACLDIYQQHQSFQKLTTITKKFNIGIISIMHDVNLASRYTKEILILDKAKLKIFGNAKEVLLSKKFYECFRLHIDYYQKKDLYLTDL